MQKADGRGATSCDASKLHSWAEIPQLNSQKKEKKQTRGACATGTHIILCAVNWCSITKAKCESATRRWSYRDHSQCTAISPSSLIWAHPREHNENCHWVSNEKAFNILGREKKRTIHLDQTTSVQTCEAASRQFNVSCSPIARHVQRLCKLKTPSAEQLEK